MCSFSRLPNDCNAFSNSQNKISIMFVVITTKPAYSYITQLNCTGDEVIIDQCNITEATPTRACWKSSHAATAHCRVSQTVHSKNMIEIYHRVAIKYN